jgi:OCT family organic cation transporter-like MFS transporter 3
VLGRAAMAAVAAMAVFIEMYIGTTGVLQLLKAVFIAFAWAFDA